MNARFSIIPARAFYDKALSKSSVMILGVLGMYGDKDGYCYPSQTTIASHIGVSRQAVQKCLGELSRLGYLQIQNRFDTDKSKITSLYRILYDGVLPDDRARTIQTENKRAVPHATPEVASHATHEVASHATPEVASHATPEVASHATPEVASHATPRGCINDPYNDPSNPPRKEEKINTPKPPSFPSPALAKSARQQVADELTQADPVFTIPDWIPADLWEGFEMHRKAVKAPLTPYARKLLMRDLEKLKAEGQDPVAVIEQTIKSGKWKGFFAVKPDFPMPVARDSPGFVFMSKQDRANQQTRQNIAEWYQEKMAGLMQ
jgi:hypothetical protein